MKLKDIMKKRYAVKLFDQSKKLTEGQIKEIKEAINLAPTSFGLQSFKVKIITDEKLKEQLQEHSWNQPQISSCSHLLVFCADADSDNLLKRKAELMRELSIPEEKIQGFLNYATPYFENKEKQWLLDWAEKQAYLAADHAMLKATELGFGSCPMAGFIPEKYHKILDLEENLWPILIVPLGYPADEERPKIRAKEKDLFF